MCGERQKIRRRFLRMQECLRNDVKGQKLAEFMKSVWHYATKYSFSAGELEDMISVGILGAIKACNSYCPEKAAGFDTYAAHCIENEIRMYLRKMIPWQEEISPRDLEEWERICQGSDIYQNEQDLVYEKYRVVLASGYLGEMEQKILMLRFGIGMERQKNREMHTQADTARILGVSQSYISRLERKALKHIRRMLING